MTDIDVIILSNAKSEHLRSLTVQTIESLLCSEDKAEIKFHILVIESNYKMIDFQYENTKTVYPNSSFNFHKYLNIGVQSTNHSLICFCNNDLIFQKGWATEILKAKSSNPEIDCFSTYCPTFHADKSDILRNNLNYGYDNGIHFTGWCFLINRSILEITGKFDEKFTFWYADDDFRLTLQKNDLKNALIKNAQVIHLGSETLNKESANNQYELKYRANAYYQFKWEHHSTLKFIAQKLKYQIQNIINRVNYKG